MYTEPPTPKYAYQRRALHDGLLTPIWKGHGELREVHKNLSHLIPPLATADIDDTITVTVLGQRLGNDRLATAESSRNGTCSCSRAQPWLVMQAAAAVSVCVKQA